MDPKPRFPGLDGAIAVAVALGLTELAAGLFASVPSAVASVGGFVVDYSPPFVKDTAIALLGTADKGALAIGTVVVALVIGVVVGRLSVQRWWIAVGAFAGFAIVGIGAQLPEPASSPLAILVVTPLAAAIGLATLRLLHHLDAAAHRVPLPTDGRAPDPSRRRFVAAAAGAGAVGIASMTLGRSAIIRRSEQLRMASALPAVDQPVALPGPANSFSVPQLTPIVQGPPDFYRIDTALVVPIVDAADWSLQITGLVEEEITLTMDDITAMEQVERYVTLACVSNEVGDDLVGNARWQGVRLTEVLDMARPRSAATQIVGRSVDGFTVGFPTEVAYDGREPLIAIGMNGEPLPRKHGYPARLVVPGLYGYVSATKWLAEIELTEWDAFDAYWVPRGWAKEAPIKTQSRIDRPKQSANVAAGPYVAAGIAWAPTRGISRVEVQLDEGDWRDADLSEPLSDDAWVQWKVDLELAAGEHRLRVRATDGTGATQTSEEVPPRPDGATGWHTVTFRAN